MKMCKGVSIALSILVMIGVLVTSAAAKNSPSIVIRTEVEILPNGDRIETTLTIDAQPNGAKATKSGHKTKSYKNSNGAVMWSVTVYGTFYYNGSTATCTSSSRSTTCPGNGWTIVSSSASKSGNTATAKATARYNNSDYTRSVTLQCSVNGTLS